MMKKQNFISVKIKYLLMGVVIGIAFMTSAITFANSSVSALLNNGVAFYFNGEHKVLPQGYEVLTYKGRTYTPARFVAEGLGAEVLWDEVTNSIFISYEEDTKNDAEGLPEEPNGGVKKGIEEIKEEKIDNKKYEKLPIIKMSYDATVTITHVETTNSETTVYLEIEGRRDVPIQLNRNKTTITVDGQTYEQGNLAGILNPIDTRWYHDIREEEKVSGWIKFSAILKDVEKMTVSLEIFRNDGSNEATDFEFDIVL